ncbi:MAG: diguanylate cyclase [Syntrophaceae bacterium]|nr:diguanylate cyclase [Syntrophaceae bacterium]
MPEKEENKQASPEIYMPRLQMVVRYILVTMTAVYLNLSPIPPLFLTLTQVNLIIAGYCIFHIFWWLYYKKREANMILIRAGAWTDTLAAAMALMFDPYIIPPTAGLLVIATLGNGIQHGLRIFIECMVGAFILGSIAIVYHFILIKSPPPYNLYLFVILLNVAVFYAYLLVHRLEKMKMEAIINSERDALTGILNRRAFRRSAEYLLLLTERTHMPLVFIFADLDRFKQVNDQFGHDMGDKVLQCFSQIAKSRLRKNDIIARYGGDEFVMILTDTSINNAEPVMNRIKGEFNEWALKNGLPVGVSFGMGTPNKDENNLDDVLRRIDAALYDAKRKTGHVR